MHGLYGPCKVTESGVTLELVKSHCARRHQWCRLCPPAPGGHVIPLQSVIKLLGLKQVASLTDKRLSLNSFFFPCNVLPNVKAWIGVKMGDNKYKS